MNTDLFRPWMHRGRISVQLYLLPLRYLFRNVQRSSRGSAPLTFFCFNVSSKGIAPNCEPLVYNTIMWCAWGHTFLCLPCATWRISKMWVGRLFFLVLFFVFFLFCFFSKAGWMLIKDEFPAGTDYWGWNVQMQMFVSVCALALLGSSSILLWFLCNVPLFKGDPPIRLVPALLRRPWLVTLI